MKQKTKLSITGLLFAFVLAGCSVANYVVPAYSTLEFEVSNKANPDLNGRPSPVVIHVYELTSNTLFESQDFFSLYEEPEEVLGPDLIAKQEFTFAPGSTELYEVSMKPEVEYVGVIAAYRDIENANWRKVIPVDKTGYEKHKLLIGELSIAVK
ncbi:type VI secretion lipoprotein [Vibrio nigripulchritudo]|uniref:type VI secretion system lipoprotein TssJ n=1 Tax=Vibrio nigripulchritudo TaxID=28173 RepID=UPI0019099C60|nr:type VI secretion system lipoprotein TssJ [Vibrio nigripulchritudo]BCL70014.1 type VI secretion lipoprotein [Vibrio nigripulchritudo]BDU31364.1 type VI secretion lipoprotein [Vibrio nigripulchritudo]